MITHDQILPSLYHLQRLGRIGSIRISALNSAPLRALAEAPRLAEAFPGQGFQALPGLREPPDRMFPDLFRDAMAAPAAGNLVVVAVPDHLHEPVIRAALEHDQHVLSVKPLVLKHDQALEIERLALEQGLFVGVEYHKRFDRRSLDARGLVPPRPLRPVPLRRGQAGRAVLLPPLELPELVHQGEQRPVHLHRLPLRRPGLLHHGPASGRGLGPRRGGEVPERQRGLPLVARAGRVGERRDPQPAERAGLSGRRCRLERPGPVPVLRRRRLRRDDPPRRPVPRRQPRLCRPPLRRGLPLRQPGLFPPGPVGRRRLEAGRLRLRLGRGQRAGGPPRQRRGGRVGRRGGHGPPAGCPGGHQLPRHHRHAGQQFDQRTGDRSRPAIDRAARPPRGHRLQQPPARPPAGLEEPGRLRWSLPLASGTWERGSFTRRCPPAESPPAAAARDAGGSRRR